MTAGCGISAESVSIAVGALYSTKQAVITMLPDALEGKIPFVCDVSDNPRLSDIAQSGHALATFDGDRAPKIARCVGCGKATSLAWHVAPVGITVPACNGDCVADRIDNIWYEAGYAIYIRRRGALAELYATGGLCVPEVVL